ncbi:MAG TPA: type IV pilin protein [Steroidobacteraceae bacterium]|nr:type IV pilin protein [Steroidobacteraceae bacterium]
MRNGFTLIELVIAMLVLAILTAIAVPSYSNYTHRAKPSDATRTMTIDAQALERCYSQGFTYVGCAQVSTSATSPQGYYTVAVTMTPIAIRLPPYPSVPARRHRIPHASRSS